MAFKLSEENGRLNCFINGILSYKFIRDKNTGNWDAYKIEENIISAKPIDSDKYRYDLAERIDMCSK